MNGTNAGPVRFEEDPQPANDVSMSECANCGSDIPQSQVHTLQEEPFCSSCGAQVALDVLDPGEAGSRLASAHDVEEAFDVYIAAGVHLKLARLSVLASGR